MAKAAKKRYRTIPMLSVFERRNAIAVSECFKDGINPLSVRLQSSGGEVAYTYEDIAILYELTGKPFDHVQSSFFLTEGDKGHERTK